MSRERLLDGKTYKFFVIMQGPLLRRGSESRVRYKCNVSPRSGGACMGELFVWVVWVLLKSEERELNRKMLTQEGFRHFFFFLYTNIFSYENCFLATLKLKWLKHDYFVFLCVCFQAEDGGGGGGGKGRGVRWMEGAKVWLTDHISTSQQTISTWKKRQVKFISSN